MQRANPHGAVGRRVGRAWADRIAPTALVVLLSGAALLRVPPVRAHSTGETGHSGKQGPTCNDCHSGGVSPAVAFSGPTQLGVGETATYRFEVTSMSASQKAAGFNVAASDGVLAVLPDEGERLVAVDGELTHTMPRANVDMVAGWNFTWTAPDVPGTSTLFGAGNSVNLNGQPTGDRANTTTLSIEVVEATSPTPTPTATPPVSPGPAGCPGDCDGNGMVTVNELVTSVNIALGSLPLSACPVLDVNGDGTVEIDELVAAVNDALNGCP